MPTSETMETQNKNLFQQLIEWIDSASDEHLKKIQECILKNPEYAQQKDQRGKTLLLHAAKAGDVKLVMWLLENKLSSTDETSTKGFNAFLYAALKGHLPLIKYFLLETDIDYQVMDEEGNNAFLLAAIKGHIDVVQGFLQDDYFEVSERNNDGETALHLAAINGHLDLTKDLIKSGADATALTNEKDTAFHYAAIGGHTAIIQWLIDEETFSAQFAWKLTNSDRYTPLHEAVISGCLNVFQLYFENYVSSFCPPKMKFKEINALSIKDKKQLFWKVEGKLLISLATAHDHLQLLNYMYAYCLPLDQNLEKLNSEVFLEATQNGSLQIVKHMITHHHVSIETTDEKNNTALHLACREGQLKIVEYLIGQGASIYKRNIYGATLLHLAAYGGEWEVILYLMTHYKFNLDLTTKNKHTVLETALYSEWTIEKKIKPANLYTAFNIVMLSSSNDAKYAHQLLWAYNAYAQEQIYKLKKDLLTITDDTQKRKLENIKNNFKQMLINTNILADFIAKIYKAVYQYMTLLTGSANIFSQLPTAVFINDILCIILSAELKIPINFKNNPIFTSLFNQINSQLRSIKNKCSNTKAFMPFYTIAPSNAWEAINTTWISEIKSAHIDYFMLYKDLLIWIEQLGKSAINKSLLQQCNSLFWNRTPLTAAIMLGLEKLVEWLLKWGADVNARDNMGDYPLHLACYYGHTEIIRLLIAQGINKSFNCINTRGNYPLHEAVLGRHIVVVQLLVEECFDKIFLIGQQAILKEKKHPTLDLEQKNYQGETAIELGWMTGQLEILQLLIDRGVPFSHFLNKPNYNKHNPYNISQWKFFKFIAFAKRISNKNINLQKNIFIEYRNLTGDFTQSDEDLFWSEIISFHATKYNIIRFIETLDKYLPFNTMMLTNLRNFLVHHSLTYLNSTQKDKNLATLIPLIMEFRKTLLQETTQAAVFAYCQFDMDNAENAFINVSFKVLALQSIFDKNLALQHLMQVIENTPLYVETVSVTMEENYKEYKTDLSLTNYLSILRGLLLNFKAITQANFSKEFKLFIYQNNSVISALNSLTIDMYECLQRIKQLKLLPNKVINQQAEAVKILEELFLIIMPLRNGIVHGVFKNEARDKNAEEEIYHDLLPFPSKDIKQIYQAITDEKIYKAVDDLCKINESTEVKLPSLSSNRFSRYYLKKTYTVELSVDSKNDPINFPKPT